MTDNIKIFVYGSCRFSERTEKDELVGNGGYGVVISLNGQKADELSGGRSNTTNARMDIIGITEALRRVMRPGDITVYLTNGYVIDTLSKGWLEKWKANGYKKKKHVDLWKDLDGVLQTIPGTISFKHSKDVQQNPEFLRAEELGKAMSSKSHLPKDTHIKDNAGGLFDTIPSLEDESNELLEEEEQPILDSICVDASSQGNPGVTEYRGVNTATGDIIFQNTYEEATNNIGEFLAIVHALALAKRNGHGYKAIYSDSLIAISWVQQKTCKTKFEKTDANAKVFDHIHRAIAWLNANTYDIKVLKWNTVAWGEIVADYGRK